MRRYIVDLTTQDRVDEDDAERSLYEARHRRTLGDVMREREQREAAPAPTEPALPQPKRASDLPRGARVLAGPDSKPGTVRYVRLAGPEFMWVDSVSVLLDERRGQPYSGTTLAAHAVRLADDA